MCLRAVEMPETCRFLTGYGKSGVCDDKSGMIEAEESEVGK